MTPALSLGMGLEVSKVVSLMSRLEKGGTGSEATVAPAATVIEGAIGKELPCATR